MTSELDKQDGGAALDSNEHGALEEDKYTNTLPAVLLYRQAHYEVHGRVAMGPGLPTTHAWPTRNDEIPYRQKLTATVDLSQPGEDLDEGEEERPWSFYRASLAYVIASQIFMGLANPLRWLVGIALALNEEGFLALSISDRRVTFNLLREESRASDLVSAYLRGDRVPNAGAVYDHHSRASFVHMPSATSASVTPADLVKGKGKVSAKLASLDHAACALRAQVGEAFGVHAWVFTPPGFLLTMAELARDGYIPFRLVQFYPTRPSSKDRDNHAFVAILKKATGVPRAIVRRSFLEPLGP